MDASEGVDAARPDAGVAFDAGSLDSGLCSSDEGCADGLCLAGVCLNCRSGPDCDGNGRSDRCDLLRGPHLDCNANGIPDRCDLVRSLDCNQSGVPDECEVLSNGCATVGTDGFVEHRAGDMPLILSMAHGGSLRPSDIPDRNTNTGADLRTLELGEALADAFETRLGRRPHLVICHLHRSKLDANRDLAEAAQGNLRSENAWFEYHQYLEAAKRAVRVQHGRGLYVDLHGLAASRDALEWGYLLSGTTLLLEDVALSHPAFGHQSSLRQAAARFPGSFADLLRGPGSLGARLDRAGYVGVPGSLRPDPGRDPHGTTAPYFSGGYNTGRHGARSGGRVDGVQLETTWAGVRDSAENRARFAVALAEELEGYMVDELGLRPRHPMRVAFDGETLGARPETTVGLELVRFGDRSDALNVALREDPGVRTAVGRFDRGADRTTVAVPAPAAPGTYRWAIASGPYAVDTASVAVVTVAESQRTPLWLVADHPVLATGRDLYVEARRAEGEGSADYEVRVSLSEGLAVEPSRLRFSAGQEKAGFFVRTRPDGRLTGHRSLTLAVAEASVTVLRLDEDLPLGLRLWWLGGADLADSARRWEVFARPPGPRRTQTLVDPERGPSVRLDGDAVVADNVEVAGATGFTVAFWFRSSDAFSSGFRYLYSHGRISVGPSVNIYLRSSGGLRTALIGTGETQRPSALDAAGEYRDGRWHHYALTVASDPRAAVYVDGALTATAARGRLPFDPTQHIYVGGRYDLTASRDFSGDMADLRVYNRPLDDAEVADLASP